MKAAIVIFPGSNREHDVAMALQRATGHEPVRVWHRNGSLPDADPAEGGARRRPEEPPLLAVRSAGAHLASLD